MDTTLYEKLLNAAFRFVSFRPRSEREMREFLEQKLKRSKIAGAFSVTKAMSRLAEYGHVDDRKFAIWWIEQRRSFRPKGIRALKAELFNKGIAREIVEEVVTKTNEEDDAKKAISKKLVLWAQIPIIEQKKKVYTFLAQRGFSSSIIEKIIDGLVKKDYN